MYDTNECLDAAQGGCAGEVYPRPALSGSGLAYSRCDNHFELYARRIGPKMADVRRRYPDTDVPPAWFDASLAGERWNED